MIMLQLKGLKILQTVDLLLFWWFIIYGKLNLMILWIWKGRRKIEAGGG